MHTRASIPTALGRVGGLEWETEIPHHLQECFWNHYTKCNCNTIYSQSGHATWGFHNQKSELKPRKLGMKFHPTKNKQNKALFFCLMFKAIC